MTELAITFTAAQEIQARQREGARGVMLLHDPRTGHAILFRVDEAGCALLGVAEAPVMDAEHDLVALPGLTVPVDATADEAFTLAEAELRRLAARRLN